MTQRRNRRAGVEDLWHKADGSPTKLDGAGKRWRARYVQDGREHTKRFARKTDAQAWIDNITTTIGTGSYIAPGSGDIPISDLHEQWIGHQGHVKPSTKAARASAWNTHVRSRWADTKISDVQKSDIRAWISSLAEHSSPSTIELALGVLRQICTLAVDDRRIIANPCDGVKAPRRATESRAYLTHQQVDELASAVQRDGDVIRFLAYTGLRYGEMAALRVQDVDTGRRRVNILRSVTEVSGKLVWGTPKTHEKRTVPYPAFLDDEIAARLEGKRPADLVFTAPVGGVLRIATFRTRIINPAVARLQGIDDDHPEPQTDWPRPTLHDLRHTAASLAISAGANVKAVQTMLGHKSAAMTLDTYSDLFPDDLEQVAAALDTARSAALA